jgi:hypothetical protein
MLNWAQALSNVSVRSSPGMAWFPHASLRERMNLNMSSRSVARVAWNCPSGRVRSWAAVTSSSSGRTADRPIALANAPDS